MKHNIDILPLADHYVVVAKNKETGKTEQVFNLNESGVDMLRLFQEGHDVTAVTRMIAEEYDVDASAVSSDVSAFADSLIVKGLL